MPECAGTAITGNPGIATIDSLRCRCVWNGERCPHPATQEDGWKIVLAQLIPAPPPAPAPPPPPAGG